MCHGRVGSVYLINIDGATQYFLPPLKLKVAARHRSKNLAREAWFYEEVEDIQGGSIAQRYVQAKPNHADPSPASNDNKITLISVLVLERLGDMPPMLVSLESIKFVPCSFSQSAHSNSPLCRPDIYEIYNDLGQVGIEQMHKRWRNILAAPPTHDSLVNPYHGHKHQWRIVDFDRMRKSSFRLSAIDTTQNSQLPTVFCDLADGYVVEPCD